MKAVVTFVLLGVVACSSPSNDRAIVSKPTTAASPAVAAPAPPKAVPNAKLPTAPSPSCSIASVNEIDSPKFDFSADGTVIANQVAGSITVELVEGQPRASIKAARYGIEVAGDAAVADLELHATKDVLFAGVLRPLYLRSPKLSNATVNTTFSLPPEIELADSNAPLISAVPCVSARYGPIDRSEQHIASSRRHLIKKKSDLRIRATAGSAVALTVRRGVVSAVEVIAVEEQKALVEFMLYGNYEPLVQVRGWLETSVFRPKILASVPVDSGAVNGILGGNGGPPRETMKVSSCNEPLPLYARISGKRIKIGRIRSNSEVAFGAVTDDVVLIGAGRPLNAARMFSTPLRLAEGVDLVVPRQSLQSCKEIGEWIKI